MNPIVGQLIEGVIQATIIAGLLFLVGARRALWLAAAGLVITGLLYVVFALAAGQPGAVPIEITGALITVVFAAFGIMRRSPAVLALGWALHPVWDVALHTRGLGTYAPDGYVVFCIGFDLALAGFIMLVAARNNARLAARMA